MSRLFSTHLVVAVSVYSVRQLYDRLTTIVRPNFNRRINLCSLHFAALQL